MITNTALWNDRPYYSTECACGYRSNWTPSLVDNDRKAAAHAKKCPAHPSWAECLGDGDAPQLTFEQQATIRELMAR